MQLRKLMNKDVNNILEWMKDEEIVQFFRFEASDINKDIVLKFINKANLNDDSYHFAIVDENDEYMGTVSLKNIDNINKNAEYAIALRKKAIGKGYAYFAGNEILKIAFEELELERVYLNILSKNIKSIAYCEKLGFKFEGEFKKHLYLKGKFENLKWYALLKEQYKCLKQNY